MSRGGTFSWLPMSVMVLFLTVSLGLAAYQPVVILKNPYASEHTDSLGNVIEDSLVRHKTLVATLYRIGMSDSLTVEGTTNDSGFCMPLFNRWPNVGSLVEPGSIERLDISLPNTYRATQTGGRFTFEPLRIERLSVTGRIGETLVVVLPLSVSKGEFTIGSGPFEFDFVVLADPHIAMSKKSINGWADFGTEGWNDSDNDPGERPHPIPNVEACVDYINTYLVGQPYDVRFVAIAGDVTHTSERSEYQRARQIFAGLDDRLFLVPLMGNHDGWPYVGNQPPPFYDFDEQSSGSVCIGEYFVDAFRGVYDTLRYINPAANWQQSDYLLTQTDQTCHPWPSYYNDFGFSYQGTRLIATDFNTRFHAPSGWPGLNYDPDTYWEEQYHWTMDWLETQVDAVPDGERIVCLGHNPYMEYYVANFNAHELHQISDRGLCNNKPIVTSIGGHLGFESSGRLLYDRGSYNDTICDFFTLGGASDGYIYVFHVKDNVHLQVTHSGSGPTLGRTVQFSAAYSYQGGENAPAQYWWDFGDGTYGIGGASASHLFESPTHDTLYKVSLRVTTESGKHVWTSDTIRVVPGPWLARQDMPAGARAGQSGGTAEKA